MVSQFLRIQCTDRIEIAIHNQILNNDLAIASCAYEPLLQPGEL